jgi:membrane peptidoglycan carboxypeptidase
MANSAFGDGPDTPEDSGTLDAAKPRHTVNPFQALALLLTFVLLAGVGGLLMAGMIIPVAAATSTVTNSGVEAFNDLPTELEPQPLAQVSYIYASDGTTLLARYYSDNRVVVGLDEISPYLQHAAIAIEDRRFYTHGGIDPKGMARALVSNLRSSDTQGASTLTQQYVKNVLIDQAKRAGDTQAVNAASEATAARKLREAKLAIALEKRMTKDEILEGYLNIAQFGSSVYGVETAAQRYFGVSAKDVSIVQAATIAGITQSPNANDPLKFPDVSERRRNQVLGAMYSEQYITKEEYEAARATPLADTLNPQPINQGCEGAGGAINAGYFCDYVTKVLIQDTAFGDDPNERIDQLYDGGLNIVTTLNPGIQDIVNRELNASLPGDNEYGFAIAGVSVDPTNGHILAMSQNRTFGNDGSAPGTTEVNFSTDRAHGGSGGFQPGSTFKAFVLAQWFESGRTLRESVSANRKVWTPKDFLPATPAATCDAGLAPTWEPRNSDGQGSGSMSVERATRFSVNTAFVTMESQLNLCDIAALADRVGFVPAEPGTTTVPRMSMVLGTQETSPLSMASAYGTFANEGTHCTPIAILSVTKADGSTITPPAANCSPELSTATTNAVNYSLEQVLTDGGAKKSRLANRTAAGKTGTTNDNKDAWFVGYTREVSTAIWMGDPLKVRSLAGSTINGTFYRNVYGSDIPAPTWKRIMDQVVGGNPDVPLSAAIAPAQLGQAPAPRAPAAPEAAAPPAAEEPAPPAAPEG